MKYQRRLLVDELVFPEGPRWYEGKLWFSEMNAQQVKTVDLTGKVDVIVTVPGSPSGLGWLPDGTLLIVSMLKRQLLKLTSDKLELVADLYDLASYHCNDMVVDKKGRAYIGNFGSDISSGEVPRPAELILVDENGQPRIVADNLQFPNGMVITPDEKTLIVGETWGCCLTAFDIQSDGSLSNRRIWANTGSVTPDGICLDEDHGIWVASPASSEVVRFKEGGQKTDQILTDAPAYACMMGGTDGKTLFILSSSPPDPFAGQFKHGGRIEMADTEFAGAGSCSAPI